MTGIKVLQIISGNDTGGGGNHVLNLSLYSKHMFDCIIGTIGGGGLYDKSRELKIDTVKFKRSATYDRHILEYIKKNQIDIVNFHGPKAFFMHYFIKNKIEIPTIATVHSDFRKDFLNNKIKYLLFTPLSQRGLRSFNKYICVSSYIENILSHENFTGKKFRVNNGIDFNGINVRENRECIREKYGISQDDFLYVNVARMHPIKNQMSLVEAFGIIKDKVKNVKLLIVGDGSEELKLRNIIIDLKLQDHVILAGYKKNAVDFINAGDVGILTSFSEGGAPPITLLESASVKKPFIAPDTGDIREIMDKDSIFLVNPNSIEDIEDKMKLAYDKREYISKMGEKLYHVCMEKFSIDNFCRQYNEIYTKILSQK
ncbi:glycosyltransferase family 4 protein [Clostridium sp. Mt-5]|uniref:Glycosyltransferase family 4 protein n=1 Tax=Clostridium moutaii TaxID=3240932 RepID=A0ABV4BQ62_9CLOT